MGNYYIPVKYLFSHILDAKIIDAPMITNKTVELGSKYSPDFVCMPFKYTLGTMIECLDKKANVLFQAGGGCRYGYYSELQERILKDLGYDFKLVNLVTMGQADVKKIYRDFKSLDDNFSGIKALYYLFITSKMVKYMDKIDDFIRQNIGFEVKKNSFINLNKEMLYKFSKVKSYMGLRFLYLKYKRKFKKIPVKKDKNHLKVGIIGELYTLMEPFSNYFLERELASYNIEVKRYTNAHYLLFEKKNKVKWYLKYARDYAKYRLGADGLDNVGRAKYLCKHGYDGIIHIKSSFCTPEISAMAILNRISSDYDIPIAYFSFDTENSDEAMKTRLEAFLDMIKMRRDRNE